MRTLADIIVALPSRGRDPLFVKAQEALRLPKFNHSATDGDEFAGAVERYVFTEFPWGMIDVEVDTPVKWPCVPCWLEISGRRAIFAYGDAEDPDFTFFFRSASGGFCIPVFHYSAREKGAHLSRDWLAILDVEPLDTWPENVPKFQDEKDFEEVALGLRALLLCLDSHRVVDVRRIVPNRGDAASRAFRRRRAQLGRPLFSFNQVGWLGDRTSIQRGESRVGDHMGGGVRKHVRAAHWRYLLKIDPETGERYAIKIRIRSSEPGNADLGRVVKERIVEPRRRRPIPDVPIREVRW